MLQLAFRTILTIAVLAISLSTAKAEFQCEGGSIVIGIAKAQTGGFAFFDNAGAQGALVAIDQINADGGIDGCQIEVTQGDIQSNPALSRQVAEEVIADGAEILLVPADFDIGVGASQAAQEASLLSLSPEASSIAWPAAIGPHHFISAITVQDLAKAQTVFAERRGWSKVYVVTNTAFDYFTSQEEVFTEYFDGEIVGRDVVADDASDYAPQISKLREVADQVDALVLNDYFPHVGTFLRQMRAAGIDLPVIGNQVYSSKALPEVVGAEGLQGVYYIAQGYYEGDDVAPKVADLIARYQERFDTFPENANVLGGYEGILLLAAALREAGSTDAAAVAEALSSQENMQLPASTVYRWVNRYPLRSATVIGFTESGKFTEVMRLDPRDADK